MSYKKYLKKKKYIKKARDIVKGIYQAAVPFEGEKKIGFIVGMQRSGTTMLNEVFDRDLRTKVYGESGLARENYLGSRFRLLPYNEIDQIFRKERALLLIVKPLVESQKILDLLKYFPGSKAIWVYRDYRGVANSSFKKFGAEPSIQHLQSVTDPKLSYHWFGENASSNTKETVKKYFVPNNSPYDLKALGWFVRNSLYFDFELQNNPNVILCKYEELVAQPEKVIPKLYAFLSVEYKGNRIINHIHTKSVGKGGEIKIDVNIASICDDMLNRFDEEYRKQPLLNNT